jgi:menaquinone-dependent protoporphyrinogen oxidase
MARAGEQTDRAGLLLEEIVPGSVAGRRGTKDAAGLLLCYATRDGQARRIAAHIAGRLAEHAIDASPRDLATAFPAAEVLAGCPLAVLVAAVRYGRHLPQAEQFLAAYEKLAAPPPLVFVSVNLTARTPGKDTALGNRYLQKTIARHRLQPALSAAVAGRLDYPHYRWFDRQIIRLIMTLTGGPTDPRTCIEFTAWAAVDEIAARIAALHDAGSTHGRYPATDAAGRCAPGRMV